MTKKKAGPWREMSRYIVDVAVFGTFSLGSLILCYVSHDYWGWGFLGLLYGAVAIHATYKAAYGAGVHKMYDILAEQQAAVDEFVSAVKAFQVARGKYTYDTDPSRTPDLRHDDG